MLARDPTPVFHSVAGLNRRITLVVRYGYPPFASVCDSKVHVPEHRHTWQRGYASFSSSLQRMDLTTLLILIPNVIPPR